MLNISHIKALGCTVAMLAAALPASADLIEQNCAVPLAAVGQVMTLSGTAVATDGAGCVRDLACGSPLYGGESISTGAGSSAGFLMGDVLTQLGPESSANLGTTAGGAPDIDLKQGSIRVVDPRDEGPPVALSALDARTEFTGADTGAAITSGSAAFCSDSPLAVSRGGALVNETPAACSTFAGGGGFGGGGLSGLAALAADTCMQVASNEHIPPTPPVSTPPGGPPVPDPPDSPPRNPCEIGVCADSPPPPRVTVQPPTTTPFPGGTGGTFGGGGEN